MTPEEARKKMIEALKKGNVKWSEHGEEYFSRAGEISLDPDFTVVKATAKFWGAWRARHLGNLGGVEISWSTVSAGFGSLTIWRNLDGSIGVDAEGMGPGFCRAVIVALDKEIQDKIQEEFNGFEKEIER